MVELRVEVMKRDDSIISVCRLPERYWNLELPHKVPPGRQLVSVVELPVLGYLEQGVAPALIAALTATGTFKPKYPFLSATRSALLHTAYHLKGLGWALGDACHR